MIGESNNGKSKTGLALFFLISPFLLYFPVIHKYFVSDDFKVLSRVCLEKTILIKGFFRPLSDITIYLNYKLDGFNPMVFNSFNLLAHGINSFLLYICCLRFGITDKKLNKQFAFIAGLLFLTYPFHNEGVVWLLGRGASMSCTFALAGIIVMLSRYSLLKRILLTCSCYFIGLLAFESIIFYPFIILIFLLIRGVKRKEGILWVTGLLITLCIHLMIRMLISGSLTGSYGGGFLKTAPAIYLLNMAKTAGRLIFPPTGTWHWLVFVYIAILVVLGILSLRIRPEGNNPSMKVIKGLCLCLCISCIVPVFTGISTITSESDRMLYFPSLFLCMIISMLLICFIRNSFGKLLICFLLLSYNIFFLEKNNLHWAIAGDTTQSLIRLIKNRPQGKTYILDVPEEYRGAFIFRQGLNDALRINSIDPKGITVMNYLTRDQVDLPPMSTLGQPLPKLNKEDEVIFWDRRTFVRLKSMPKN